MRLLFLLTFVIAILTMQACFEPEYINTGFEANFDTNSKGTSMMLVDNKTNTLFFDGLISIDSGGLIIKVLKPDGSEAYSLLKNDTVLGYKIQEQFVAVEGIWTIQYNSIGGKGSISVKLHN